MRHSLGYHSPIKTLAVFLFIAGVYFIGMSYHAIDMSVNMQYGAIDTNGVGFTQDRQTMYMNGMTEMSISSLLMIGGFSMLYGVKEIRP
jgi:hypothetical protein